MSAPSDIALEIVGRVYLRREEALSAIDAALAPLRASLESRTSDWEYVKSDWEYVKGERDAVQLELSKSRERERVLREALQALVHAVDPNGPQADGSLESFFVEPVDRARAALAKAQGSAS